jgi:hypothetical protein
MHTYIFVRLGGGLGRYARKERVWGGGGQTGKFSGGYVKASSTTRNRKKGKERNPKPAAFFCLVVAQLDFASFFGSRPSLRYGSLCSSINASVVVVFFRGLRVLCIYREREEKTACSLAARDNTLPSLCPLLPPFLLPKATPPKSKGGSALAPTSSPPTHLIKTPPRPNATYTTPHSLMLLWFRPPPPLPLLLLSHPSLYPTLFPHQKHTAVHPHPSPSPPRSLPTPFIIINKTTPSHMQSRHGIQSEKKGKRSDVGLCGRTPSFP